MKAVLLSAVFLLSSCGMQGDLYLPKQEEKVEQPDVEQPKTETPESE